MFKKNKDKNISSDSIIGANLSMNVGTLKSSQGESTTTHVYGIINGNLEIENIIVGPTGELNGDITADTLLIAGRVTGKIKCNNLLQLASSAFVEGDIQTANLIVDKGATVIAKINVINKSNPTSLDKNNEISTIDDERYGDK